jgi:hypothetical protein
MDEIYDLDRLLKDNKYDITHRGRIYQRIMKKLPGTVKSHLKGRPGRKSEIIFKSEMYPAVLLAVQSTKKEMTITGPGYIYAFFASNDTINSNSFKWMKIGVSADYKRRLKEYKGPQAPRTTIGIFAVQHMKNEEDNLIAILDQLYDKTSREWYHCDDSELAERLILKLFRDKMKID